ncbi:unnamed protein product [Lymnaea stagnalis]|uniref:Uncharacterized protein n=1 Tax=Lymnaea stagnalis TaxID=6523 RepID=A0AAV2HSZ3_LYMST
MTTQLVSPEVVSAGIIVMLVLPDGQPFQKRIFEKCTAFELKVEYVAQEQLNDYRVELHFTGNIKIMEDDEEFGHDNLNSCNQVRIVHSQSPVPQPEGLPLVLKSKPQE